MERSLMVKWEKKVQCMLYNMHTCVDTHMHILYILEMYISALSKDLRNKNQTTSREGIKMTE